MASFSCPSAPTVAARAAVAGLMLCLVAGLLVPIYTDEISWRMQLSRSLIDGGFDRGLSDQCGANQVIIAPWFLQPMRHLSAWAALAFPDPRLVRIGGVAMALGWVALAWRVTARGGDAARAALFALVGLGVMPFLLVWSRPEQPLLLGCTIAMLIALRPADRPIGGWWRAAALLVIGIVTLGYHPKAIVFLPIVLVATAVSSKARIAVLPRAAAIGLLIVAAVATSIYWKTRLACPADAMITQKFAAENIGTALQLGAAGGNLLLLASNMLPFAYAEHASPASSYMSDWLPEGVIPGWIRHVWRWSVRPVLSLAAVAAVGAAAVRLIEAIRRRQITRETALTVTIAVVYLLWAGTQINKNAYEGALLLPLLGSALVLAVPWDRWRAARHGAVVLTVFALASEVLLLAHYVPALGRTAQGPGPIADQAYSFSPWRYATARRDILAAAAACAIDPVHSRHLLVDDLTYFPLLRSREPYNRMTLLGPWQGAAGDPIAYLAAHGSSGAVLACRDLPPALRRKARSVGPFCCLTVPAS